LNYLLKQLLLFDLICQRSGSKRCRKRYSRCQKNNNSLGGLCLL